MSIDSSQTEAPEVPVEMKYSYYGLTVYSYDGGEYAVADSDDAADEAAAENICENLWAFRTRFIVQHIGTRGLPSELDDKCIKAIEEMQGKLCESANPIIQALLCGNLDNFIDDAIEADGRGHFLSAVDGQEHEGEDIYPAWKGKLVYRIN